MENKTDIIFIDSLGIKGIKIVVPLIVCKSYLSIDGWLKNLNKKDILLPPWSSHNFGFKTIKDYINEQEFEIPQ